MCYFGPLAAYRRQILVLAIVLDSLKWFNAREGKSLIQMRMFVYYVFVKRFTTKTADKAKPEVKVTDPKNSALQVFNIVKRVLVPAFKPGSDLGETRGLCTNG